MVRRLTLFVSLWLIAFVLGGGTIFTGLSREDFALVKVAPNPSDALTDASITSALNFVGSTPATMLLRAGTWTISTSVTIPAHVTLQLVPGTLISVAGGQSLVINGPIAFPGQQVFTGAGQVVWGRTKEILPEWWGARGDGVTNSLLGFRQALSSLAASSGGRLTMGAGTYLLVPDASFYVASLGSGTTVECAPAAATVLKLGGPAELDGQARAFFQINNANDTAIRGCVFDYSGHTWQTGAPLQLYWAVNVEGTSQRAVIERNEFRNNPGTQSVVVGGSGIGHVVRGNRFLNGCKDIPGGNPNCPDHTALYVQSLGATVEANLFEWDAALGDPTGARSGVEIHTSASGLSYGAKVIGNQFKGVSLGIRLECDTVGSQLVAAEVAHNVIENAQIGIFLSSAPGVTAGQCDIRKANIHDNQVDIKESSVLDPNTTGIIGIGTSPFGGSNRIVLYSSAIQRNLIELAQAHKAYSDNELGIWVGSVFHSEISDNQLINGTVARVSTGLFGVRQTNVRRNIFSNVVTDFQTPQGLLWLDLTDASVSTQGLLVQGNVFTRDPASPPVPNIHAIQIDGALASGHNIVFESNYIRGLNDQFVGTLGSLNRYGNTMSRFGVLDVVKDVDAVQSALAIYTDADPTGVPALLKIERGSDGTRDIIGASVNGIGVMRLSPTGCLHLGGGTGLCGFSRSGVVLDFGPIAAGTVVEAGIPVAQAATGDLSVCAPDVGGVEGVLMWSCFAVPGQVVVRLHNTSTAAVDPAAAAWGAAVFKTVSVIP